MRTPGGTMARAILPAEVESSFFETSFKQTKASLRLLHGRVPLLRRLPPRAVAIVVLVGLVNCIVWAAVGVVLV